MTIQVKVISRVEIPTISEKVISDLIKAEILKDNPNIIINDIAFERKLNPNRITASVDAEMATGASANVENTNHVVVEDDPTDSDEDVKTEPEESDEDVTTVSDLFEDDD